MISKHLKPLHFYNTQYQLRYGLQNIKKLTTQVETKPKPAAESTEISLENARPFEQIPGPTAFQFIRSILPGGAYYKKPLSETIVLLSKQYGHIYRMPAMFGGPATVITMNPDDYSIIFRNEGQWPVRTSFDSMVYHREVHRRDFFQGVDGIIHTSGEKWYNVRTIVNPILMQPKNARLYLNAMLEVNDEFLQRIREARDPATNEMPDTFEDEINRLTLESVAAVALNTQLGLLRKNRDSAESKTLLSSLHKFFDLAYDMEILPPIWKIVKTPKFYQMMKALDTLTDICIKYIDDAFVKIERDAKGNIASDVGKEKSVLEKLARHDKKVAVVMALDMLMAGVDTTSTALVGILLCIAKNPDKQQKLFDEIKQILPQKDSQFTMDNMKNLPYLRACIKEGIRLYPVGAGTLRKMPHDVVFSGYRVVKGSDVTTGALFQLRDEKFVPRANEFIPERFLRHEGSNEKLAGAMENPFLYLPFGFGPRMCVGKRIVDMELEINVARLVRNFNIEFNYPVENAFKERFIRVPAIPLNFKLEERRD